MDTVVEECLMMHNNAHKHTSQSNTVQEGRRVWESAGGKTMKRVDVELGRHPGRGGWEGTDVRG